MSKEFRQLDYKVWGSNRISLTGEMEQEIKTRFKNDRENKFQIFLICSGIRRKYLDTKTNSYKPEFQKWYNETGMDDVFGSLSNFTKYSSCGEVVNYVGTKTSNPEKYLKQLPLTVGTLYEIFQVLKKDKDLFNILLHYTPTRKSISDPKHEWVTKKPPLINPNITEIKVRTWRMKFDNPPPPKQKRTDKRTLPFINITCNGELWDFDKKTGDKIGCLDLDEVETFFKLVSKLFNDENKEKFKIEGNLDYLINGYYRGKERYDPSKNILKGKSTEQKYV